MRLTPNQMFGTLPQGGAGLFIAFKKGGIDKQRQRRSQLGGNFVLKNERGMRLAERVLAFSPRFSSFSKQITFWEKGQ